MKLFMLSLCTLLSFQAHASSVADGIYYKPSEEMGDEYFMPETILELKDGIYTNSAVHNGAVLTVKAAYKISGDKLVLIHNSETEVFDCNGLRVEMEGLPEDQTMSFTKLPNGIEFDYDGEKVSLDTATSTEIDRIMSLPRCQKLN